MFQHQIDEVKKYFKTNFLNAKESWLEECMQWAMQNQPPTERTITKLQQFAYQQWLLADLREVGCGCLPANLSEQRVTILPGKYTVQAERMLDIANSMYSQVKALRGGAVEVDEDEGDPGDEDELTEWGRAPKNTTTKLKARKLQLYICDGKEELYAFEYRPLPQLTGMIFPGVKLLVSGPVECRRGMLLLEPHHLKVLGGELDVLMVPNAPENCMARTLGLPENPEPYKDVQSTVGEVRRGETGGRAVPTVRPLATRTGPQQPVRGLDSQLTRAGGHVAPQPNATRPASGHSSSHPPASKSASSQFDSHIDDDDGMDDFDLTEEDLLALEMESSRVLSSSSSLPHAPRQPCRVQPVPRAPTSRHTVHQTAGSRHTAPPCNQNQYEAEMEEDYSEMDLDELESQVLASNPLPLSQPYQTNSRPNVNTNWPNGQVNNNYNSSKVAQNVTTVSGKGQAAQRINTQSNSLPRKVNTSRDTKLTNPSLTSKTSNQVNSHQNEYDAFEEEEDIWDENKKSSNDVDKFNCSGSKKHTSVKSLSLCNAASELSNKSKLHGSYSEDYGMEKTTRNQSATNLHSNMQTSSGQQNSSKASVHPFQQISKQLSRKSASHSEPSVSLSAASQPPPKKLKGVQSDIRSFTSTKKREIDVCSSPVRDELKTSSIQSSKPNLSKFMNDVSKSESINKKCTAASRVSGWPFVYLCQVQNENSRPRTATVKACVVTLLQKLKSEAGLWELKLRLADGSANLDVCFSSEILESIIGFSVAEFITIKQMARGNPIQKEKLLEGLQGLKQKLIDLNCMMKIDLSPGKTPCVVKLESITKEHMKELQSRRCSKLAPS